MNKIKFARALSIKLSLTSDKFKLKGENGKQSTRKQRNKIKQEERILTKQRKRQLQNSNLKVDTRLKILKLDTKLKFKGRRKIKTIIKSQENVEET